MATIRGRGGDLTHLQLKNVNFFQTKYKKIQHARNIFFFLAFFCNVNLCFSSQDYHRYKGCLLFISYFEYKNRSTLTIFFFYKLSITEHSGMIVICKKK